MEANRRFHGEILFEISSVFVGVALAAHFEAALQCYSYSLFLSRTEYYFYIFSIEALIAASTFGVLLSYYSCAKYFPPSSVRSLVIEVLPLFLLFFFSSIPFILNESQLLVELTSYTNLFLNLMPILVVVSGILFLLIVRKESTPLRNRPTERTQFRIIVLDSAIPYVIVFATCAAIIVLSYLISLSSLVQFNKSFFDTFLQLVREMFRLILEVLRRIFAL